MHISCLSLSLLCIETHGNFSTMSRSFLSQILLLSFLLSHLTVAAPLQNTTLLLPPGTTDHNQPGLLCTPAKWTDILIFMLVNYAAHAVTTRSLPGEQPFMTFMAILGAFFLPGSGSFRGMRALLTMAVFGGSDLEVAARAGALCMLVRKEDWEPREGDVVANAFCEGEKGIGMDEPGSTELVPVGKSVKKNWVCEKKQIKVYDGPWTEKKMKADDEYVFGRPGPHARTVHGAYSIPPGYRLKYVPPDATFLDPVRVESRDSSGRIAIASNYNSAKAMIALAQVIYASVTLYRSRGDQVERFGYAAFGLTVAPYLVVSVVNFLAGLVCPEYMSVYLVESSIMDEARRRGLEYCFHGTVGRLDEDAIKEDRTTNDQFRWLPKPIRFTKSSELSAETGTPEIEAAEMPVIYLKNQTPVTQANWNTSMTVYIPSWNPPKVFSQQRRAENYLFTPSTRRTPIITFALQPPSEWSIPKDNYTLFGILINLIPLFVIAGISKFHNGHSTYSQRSWTMAWLIVGMLVGPVIPTIGLWEGDNDNEKDGGNEGSVAGRIFMVLIFGIPAIGGFVVVGEMILRYGSCIEVG